MKEFTPPFRLGKKNKRAILDSMGKEVVIFPAGLENYAVDYVNFLNSKKMTLAEIQAKIKRLIKKRKKFICYEIWRPNIPDNGCEIQCQECKEKYIKNLNSKL